MPRGKLDRQMAVNNQNQLMPESWNEHGRKCKFRYDEDTGRLVVNMHGEFSTAAIHVLHSHARHLEGTMEFLHNGGTGSGPSEEALL